MSINFNSLDLNLLRVFDALMRTRSVTLASEKVGLSPSATSNSLQRLRDALGARCSFTRPGAWSHRHWRWELEIPIRNTLDQLRDILQRTRVFEPATATRSFRLQPSDIAQMVHMPLMRSELRKQAPGVALETLALPLREAKQAMVDGVLDLAMGFLPDLGADFHRQFLFSETWTCLVSKDHPTIGKTLTEAEYIAASPTAYRPAVSIHSMLDQLRMAQFSFKGIKRKIGLSVSYWTGLASTIAACDLIRKAPVGPALSMTKLANVRIVPLPFDLPEIDLCMRWHALMHRDHGNDHKNDRRHMTPRFSLAASLPTTIMATLIALAPALKAQAQTAYPSKPIRLVVAFAADGIADSVARQIGSKLSARLGQPVVVDNPSGAGGNTGARAVAADEPDGYTLLVTMAALAVNASFYKNAGYTVTDFVPVALLASTPNLFATNAANPAKSLNDQARDYEGRERTYSTASRCSASHLTAHDVFKNLMGIDAVHVPYGGGAPAVNAALAGHVELVSVSMPTAMTNVKAGRLKGIAVASLKRVDALPAVATVAEAGVRAFEDRSWVGVLAPAKTSPETARRLNADINDIIRKSEMREQLVSVGFEPSPGSSAEFADYLKKEVAKWADIVKATGVTIND